MKVSKAEVATSGESIRITLNGKNVYHETDENGDLVLIVQGGYPVALNHEAIKEATRMIQNETLRGALHDAICVEIIETSRLEVLRANFK